MSMTIADQLPTRIAAAITDDGIRCVLCDRLWPKDEMPLWHTHVVSDTKPVATCSCDGDPKEPRWRGFEVFNSKGRLVAASVVCPQCVTTKGLEAAVRATCFKAMCTDRNTN